MKSVEHIRDFLNAFVNWASVEEDVQALGLVGSYARGEARDDSARWKNTKSKIMEN